MKAAINLAMAVRIGLIGVRTSPKQTIEAIAKMPQHERKSLKGIKVDSRE